MSFNNPTINGPSKKRRRLSRDFNSARVSSTSPPEREGTTGSHYIRESSPPRRPLWDEHDGQESRITPGRIRRRDSNSPPRTRRDSYRDREGEYDRYDGRNGGSEVYRPGYSAETRAARYPSPPRPTSLNIKGSSLQHSNTGSPNPDRSRKDSSTIRLPKVNHATTPRSPAAKGKPTQVDQIKIAEELGHLFTQAIEDFTASAVLKIQQKAAKKEFDKRDEEYKKSKPSHEKFPQVEESQRKSRDRAENKLKLLSEQSHSQDAKLSIIGKQSALTLVPAIISSGVEAKSQLYNDELERIRLDFQSQIDDLKSYIEEHKRTRLDDGRKHQVADAESKASIRALNDNIKALTDKNSEMSEIISDIPRDIKQQLDMLSGIPSRVNTLDSQYNKVKEDYVKLEKEIGACSKTLGEYKQQASGLEGTIDGIKKLISTTKNPSDLHKKVTDIETKLKTFESSSVSQVKISTTNQKTLGAIQSRVQLLEGRFEDIPVLNERIITSESLDDINKEIRGLKETATRTSHELNSPTAAEDRQGTLNRNLGSQDLTLLNDRVRAVETDLKDKNNSLLERVSLLETEINQKISDINQSADKQRAEIFLPDGVSIKSKLSTVETRLQVLERQGGIANNPPFSTSNSLGLNIDDFVKRVQDDVILIVKNDMVEINKEGQAAHDELIGTQLQKFGDRCSSLETGLSSLQKEIVPLQQSYQTLEHSIDQLFIDLESFKTSSVTTSIHKTIETICNQPGVLPHLTIDQLEPRLYSFYASAGINQAMKDRIEGVQLGISSVDSRLSNINTKEMADYILSQMDSIYPHARNCQNSHMEHENSLQSLKEQINTLVLSLNELKNQTNLLENRPHTVGIDITAGLTAKFVQLETQMKEIQHTAETAINRCDQYQLDTGDQFAMVTIDIQSLQKSMKTLKAPESQRSSLPEVAPPPKEMLAPRSASRASTVDSSRSAINGGAPRKPGLSSSTPQPASQQSDGSTKKRRFNGSTSPTGRRAANGTNGTSKRKKIKSIDGDDSDDEDFEPELEQPQILVHSDEE